MQTTTSEDVATGLLHPAAAAECDAAPPPAAAWRAPHCLRGASLASLSPPFPSPFPLRSAAQPLSRASSSASQNAEFDQLLQEEQDREVGRLYALGESDDDDTPRRSAQLRSSSSSGGGSNADADVDAPPRPSDPMQSPAVRVTCSMPRALATRPLAVFARPLTVVVRFVCALRRMVQAQEIERQRNEEAFLAAERKRLHLDSPSAPQVVRAPPGNPFKAASELEPPPLAASPSKPAAPAGRSEAATGTVPSWKMDPELAAAYVRPSPACPLLSP